MKTFKILLTVFILFFLFGILLTKGFEWQYVKGYLFLSSSFTFMIWLSAFGMNGNIVKF